MTVPWVIRGLGSFSFRPTHPGNLTMSDQFPACVQAIFDRSLSLLVHSHGEAFSAASEGLLMACLFHAPVIPIHLQTCHPHLQQSSITSAYFPPFRSLASFIRLSQGTMSSSITTCFDVSETSTISNPILVFTMSLGNLSCFPRSTLICQSCAVPKRPACLSDLLLSQMWCCIYWCSTWPMVLQMYYLQHLVPAVGTLPKCFRTAGDVFQCSYPLAQGTSWCFSPVVPSFGVKLFQRVTSM